LINLLDAVTISQIAAGEIIERPVSVVKELVENSVDSGATRIAVAVEDGGAACIEVADDGSGITPADLSMAVRRHATSKLTRARDLESIGSLGFRGEGLASIAAVSRMHITSRKRVAQVGASIEAFGEDVSAVSPTAAPVGTTVRALRLFENVPVRREYLRTPASEFNRISGWLSAFCLAYPHITFTLKHNGKEVWVMPATMDLRQRLPAVFGKDAAEGLIALDASAASALTGTLRGYISAPGMDRPDRRMQVLFVNGRLLRSTVLAGAWTAGYSTFTMLGRQPFGVLFLDLPPGQVDANVHPTKSDVRLRFAHQVFEAVRRSIAATLHARATSDFRDAVSLGPPALDTSLEHLQTLFEHSPDVDQAPGEYAGGPRLRVLAQLENTYILATDGSALVLVDQHAAHERIAYENIVRSAQEPAAVEPMLVPVSVELNAQQSAALDATLEILRAGGLAIESFGERSYRITATPAGYQARPFDLGGFLEDLTDGPKAREVHERIWASLACHSVTRAGERLEHAEMTMLLERLQQCENPMHCPHGRPTIVRLDSTAIARLFKRA